MKRSIPNLDLNLLKAFVITYRERNLKRAAQAMALTAPAVSIKLSKLTDEIGGQLFIKVPTGFEPTTLADELYDAVDPVLNRLYDNLSNLQDFDPSQLSDHIVMDIGQHFITWFAPKLFRNLQQEAPDTSLTTNAFSANTIERLKRDEIDIGIQYARIETPKEIMEIPLKSNPMTIIVGKHHPYKAETATISDLACYELAMIELNLSGITESGHFVHEAAQYGVELVPKFTSPSVGAIADVLANSTMFCPASQHVLDLYPDTLRSIQLLDMQDRINHPVSAYMHRRNRHSVKHKWLLEIIETEFPK
ncbi:transcriptional regulator LysR family [Vibrio maritimus]|uniref:Transcriptional regulator LysR family n=1 Tax=Vibrio maritimus TaxID=990268 RepID=A0A090U118_9VIBR|nr:transcriptional regulator LysR family [Vibrio maritimus]